MGVKLSKNKKRSADTFGPGNKGHVAELKRRHVGAFTLGQESWKNVEKNLKKKIN